MAMRTSARKPRGQAHRRSERPSRRTAAPSTPKAKAGAPTPNGRPPATWEAQRKAWEARYAAGKERPGLYPFTISGVPIKPLYTPEDLAGIDLSRDLGYPGEYPYTRGIHAS